MASSQWGSTRPLSGALPRPSAMQPAAPNLEQLRAVRDQKAKLVQHLESEKFWLMQPTELEFRVEMLERALHLAEHGSNVDPAEKIAFMKKLVDDLRDDHHHTAIQEHGIEVTKLSAGVFLNVPFTDTLAKGIAEAEAEELARKTPSAQTPHNDIGKPGLFAQQYMLVRDPWERQNQGLDKREPPGDSNLAEVLKDINAVSEFFDKSIVGRTFDKVADKVDKYLPESLKQHFRGPEITYGCGDVYVDMSKLEDSHGAVMKQMAAAGVPIYGRPAPVTKEWLEDNGYWQEGETEVAGLPVHEKHWMDSGAGHMGQQPYTLHLAPGVQSAPAPMRPPLPPYPAASRENRAIDYKGFGDTPQRELFEHRMEIENKHRMRHMDEMLERAYEH